MRKRIVVVSFRGTPACVLVMVLFVVFMVTVLTGHASAEDKSESDRLAKIVAPYLDGQTLVVVHLDLMAFDALKAVDAVARLAQMPDRDRNSLQAQVAPINVVTQSMPTGTTIDVFVVAGLADLARLPFFLVLPLDETTPANAISAEARRDLEKAWGRPLTSEPISNAIVTGSPETIDRLKKSQAVARSEVAAAFQVTGHSAVQLAFIPPPELRNLVENVVPELPKQLGGGSTKAFTQGVVWIAVGIDLPPKPIAVHVILQSADAEAAALVERELSKLFEAIGQLPQIRDAIPRFDELSKRLLPKASGDQLRLDLTEENNGIAALVAIFVPVRRALNASIPGR
jgi:hypothetical protein